MSGNSNSVQVVEMNSYLELSRGLRRCTATTRVAPESFCENYGGQEYAPQ